MSRDEEPCVFLEWDSEFFGFPISRVASDRLTPELASGIDAWCAERAIRCLYFHARSDCPTTTQTASSCGYQLVDVRITLRRSVEPTPQPTLAWRTAVADDVPVFRTMAREAYADSRFFFDLRFDRDACAQLYDTWIRVSCEGWATAVVTSGPVGEPVGYVTCHVDDPAHGRIGLVGVDGGQRGKGVGSALLESALLWFAQHGVSEVSVVTQGRNIGAQRLYQRRGFLSDRLELTYHKWFGVP